MHSNKHASQGWDPCFNQVFQWLLIRFANRPGQDGNPIHIAWFALAAQLMDGVMEAVVVGVGASNEEAKKTRGGHIESIDLRQVRNGNRLMQQLASLYAGKGFYSFYFLCGVDLVKSLVARVRCY